MLIISTIWFTLDLWSQCSEAISAYARLVKFNPSILRVQKCLTPLYIDVELISPDHHVVSGHDDVWKRCILKENTFILKFSERSSYNATIKQSRIRCNQYKWYDMAIIILCLWSPSSKHRHDHRRPRRDTLISIVASLSSRQLLLLRLSLPLSDKVKQL